MDLLIDFVMRLAGFFILSYFLYSIFGRRRKIPVIVLSILLFASLVSFYSILNQDWEIGAVVLYFTVTVLPIILAFYLFLTFTGGIQLFKLKFRRNRLKGISSDIQTKRLLNLTSYIMIAASIILGVLAGFYEILFLPLFITILGIGIYILYRNSLIQSESVILFVGRNKELIYEFLIKKDKMKVLIKDFFSNDLYIVDPIGQAVLIYDDQKIEKHYLYWIATGETITIDTLKSVSKLPYQTFIDRSEKYHYRTFYFHVGKTGSAELIKEKKIK